MRKNFLLILTLVLVFLLCSCYVDGSIIESLPKYETKEFYTDRTVQNFTNFGKYYFTEIEASDFEGNEYFTKVTEEDVETIKSYVENFNEVVGKISEEDAAVDLVKNYEFNTELVGENDYFYVKTREGTAHADGTYGKFDYYSVYFMDMDSKVLYYFHCDA